jgi:CRISPR/Cas system-associated endoribonuclease Cas2
MKAQKLTKIILTSLLVSGAVAIAATSPYFAQSLIKDLKKYAKYRSRDRKQKKKFYDTFYYLKNKGLINIEYEGKQMHISLTEEGKEKAGKYQIDNLEIKKPRKWDKQWRVLIFDIKNKDKIKREALRGKIKELGLFQLQKSVWICPYEFKKEVDTLRSFFNLTNDEMQVINAYEIENDEDAKTFFNIK